MELHPADIVPIQQSLHRIAAGVWGIFFALTFIAGILLTK